MQWNCSALQPGRRRSSWPRGCAPGGWLDLVLVDAASGEIVEWLTEDRAKDVEPAWTPDGTHLVFRSDRDGVSNLYALRFEDRALLRVTNVLGGAFAPDVDPSGGAVAFASYTARGYDVHVTPLDLRRAARPPMPFEDPYPAARPLPPPADGPDRPYRPFPTALPRFWRPYGAHIDDEWRWGVATAGADPLLRHAYGASTYWGSDTERVSAQAYYQYDRFRPTFAVSAQQQEEPEPDGPAAHARGDGARFAAGA